MSNKKKAKKPQNPGPPQSGIRIDGEFIRLIVDDPDFSILGWLGGAQAMPTSGDPGDAAEFDTQLALLADEDGWVRITDLEDVLDLPHGWVRATWDEDHEKLAALNAQRTQEILDQLIASGEVIARFNEDAGEMRYWHRDPAP